MDGRHTTLFVLIAFGVLIWLFLLVIVYALWKIKRLQKAKKGEALYSILDETNAENDMLDFTKESSDDFCNFPASYYTLRMQRPLSQYNYLEENQRTNTAHRKLTSSKSLGMYDLSSSENSWMNPISTLAEKQRKMSEGVITHLVRQGRKVSEMDLRHSTSAKETPCTSITSISPSECSSTSVNEEEFDSSNVIGLKKKLAGKRRLRRQDQICGAKFEGPTKMFKKSGRINFTIEYLENEEKLAVNILNASELTPKRDEQNINPFVVVYLKPGKKQKQHTQICKQTKQPIFDKKMIFTKIKTDDLLKHMLQITLKSHGSLKKHEYLGEVSIALHSIEAYTEQSFDVNVYIERAETALTSVNISLCHKATSSKLEVTIKSVKNLPKKGTSGTYVSLMLFKENDILRHETSMKRNSRDPIYNETFEFNVHTDSITPLSTYSLVVSLHNHNMIGKDEVFGHVIFNQMSPYKSTIQQWRIAEEVPYEIHTSWHSIVDPAEL